MGCTVRGKTELPMMIRATVEQVMAIAMLKVVIGLIN
jgi:hypothetical protein